MQETDAAAIASSLKKFSLRAMPVTGTPLISVFDDVFFENYDYDIISGPDRARIQHALKAEGWKQKSSRAFIKDKTRCGLAKPSHTLGCNPADKVIDALDEFDFLVVTPTQAVLVMAAQGPWRLDQLAELAFLQGYNVDKVRQWIEHDHLEVRFPVEFLKDVQRNGYLKRKGHEHQDLEALFSAQGLEFQQAGND